MKSKEILYRTIEFRGSRRLPYWVQIDMGRFVTTRNKKEIERLEQIQTQAFRDIVPVYYGYSRDWVPKRDLNPYKWPVKAYSYKEQEDEWGVGWKEKRIVFHPLEKGWGEVDNYTIPAANDPERFSEAKKIIKNNQDKYILGYVWLTLFERLWSLRGFTNMLLDPLLHEELFLKLRDMVVDFNLMIIDQWLEMGVDGIFFSDDWGTQKSLIVSPEYWKRYYKPCYRKLFERVHQGQSHVWLHSCGNIRAIIPDLIEIGLDVLNPIQPRAMNIDELGKSFGGQLCFFGGVDIQNTLPYGRPDDVKKEVEHLVATLGRYNGGYIGGTSHSILPDTPLENIETLFEAFKTYCRNPQIKDFNKSNNQ